MKTPQKHIAEGICPSVQKRYANAENERHAHLIKGGSKRATHFVTGGSKRATHFVTGGSKRATHFVTGGSLRATHFVTGGSSVNNLVMAAIQYGLTKSFNIIYDTTFAGNTNKMDEVMGWLRAVKPKYHILLVHITANPSVIRAQLKGRHVAMAKDGYVRGIKTSLTAMFVAQNKEGFEAVKEAYRDSEYKAYRGTSYTPNDIQYIELTKGVNAKSVATKNNAGKP